jgi:hypothetical protein
MAVFYPGQPFAVQERTNATSVAALASKLKSDFLDGTVSARAFDHRARVVRQQTALLPCALASHEHMHGATRPAHVAASYVPTEVGRFGRAAERWENEGGKMLAGAGTVGTKPGQVAPYQRSGEG